MQVDIQVVGVGNSQGIDLSAGVPFQLQNRGIPLFRCGKGRDGGVGRHLFQNPVVCLFRGTPGNHTVILVRRSMAVAVSAVGVAPKLLLVFPENNLRRNFIIVLIDSGNRKGGAGFPAIDRGQGNAALGSGREHIQVIAVGPILRSIGVLGSVVGNPALHTVDRMGHTVRIRQHIMPVGAAAGAGTFLSGSVRIVSKKIGRRRGIIMLPVRAHILIAQPGACFLAHACRKRLGGEQTKDAYRTE